MNLFEKIQAVSMEIMNIEKNMKVGSGSYAYKAVSDFDVTLEVKKAEQKFKLLSIPIKQELVSSNVHKALMEGNKEKLTFEDNVKMTVRIIDIEKPADFIEVESFGKGLDSGDKGFGKASTYARKYALLNAYKIATGEDPDADKSNDIKVPSTISEKRQMVFNYLNGNNVALQGILKHFQVGKIDDLGDKEISTIYSTYKQKNLI